VAWRRASATELALAAGGLLLLIVTFLPWYHGPGGVSANAWQAFGLLDLLLLIVVLLALAPFAASAGQLTVPRTELGLALLGAASCATILVAYRMLNPPGADNDVTSVAVGAWLGLLVCGAVVAAGYRVSQGADRA
jgi:hypothetical protein